MRTTILLVPAAAVTSISRFVLLRNLYLAEFVVPLFKVVTVPSVRNSTRELFSAAFHFPRIACCGFLEHEDRMSAAARHTKPVKNMARKCLAVVMGIRFLLFSRLPDGGHCVEQVC